MERLLGSLLGRVALCFEDTSSYVPSDLSAAMRLPGGSLIVAADERASIEVLRPSARGHVYGEHQSYALSAALGIAPGAEVDLEGVTCDDQAKALYVIGSHSAKRKKPRGKSADKDLARLATVQRDPSRFVLARLALDGDVPQLDASKVAVLPSDGSESLLGLLADDPHLAPFVAGLVDEAGFAIPGKDNGLDIEGLVRVGDRLLVGLRGPVLRGWAMVLDFELAVHDGALSFVSRGKRRYRKHVLDLDGLGVRDLLLDGDEVLVLAGPTMTLDGAHRLFRWRVPSAKQDSVCAQEKGKLVPLFDVPFTRGYDRAEGVARCSWFDEDDALLVVYDAPSLARRRGPGTVLADVFSL